MDARRGTTLEVYRHEVKYYINAHDAALLRSFLGVCMRRDSFCGEERGYRVRSLYFDTPDNRDFLDKVNGYSERKKIRLRYYNSNDEAIKLEIKNKQGSYTRKETVEISKGDAAALISGDSTALLRYASRAAGRVYLAAHLEKLRPVVLVDYEREAYFLPFQNIRITIDKSLRASPGEDGFLQEDVPMVQVLPDRLILEAKYDAFLPGFIRGALSDIAPQLTSASKYCLSRLAAGN